MVYAANHGFVIDDIFIKANFRYLQRRQEADHAEKYFLKKNFKRVIETDTKDNNVMCCNLVSLNGAVVIGKGVSKKLKKDIRDEGWEVREAEMDEFLKGGGSVKCLTLEYFKSN